jgi:nucleotide-binding universal stress UspA family protein
MESPIKKILVFLEANESSMDAVRYAVMMAKFHQAKLWTIFVVDMKALQDLLRARIFIKTEELEYEHDLEEDGRRYLNYAAEIAREKAVEITPLLIKGIVHREVVKKVRELGINLLVIGELKESMSRRDAFYDESQQVFQRSPCPVLVVKGGSELERLFESF